MKITHKGDYALKAVLDLAVHYEDGLSTIQAIAQRIDAPSKFLEQVLVELKKGGFIESRRGKIGGYRLAKRPNEITLGEIIRYVDGPLEPIACINNDYVDCEDLYKCVFRPVWQSVFQSTSTIVDGITFEDLAKKITAASQAPTYSI
ncbi:MAG: Rrf2 family transcriptional regulator [Candidatus Omnitrophica bacterium]|nr:Rrf2 family transcriptional regulator [Candidatus Omnitrophota bacterium]